MEVSKLCVGQALQVTLIESYLHIVYPIHYLSLVYWSQIKIYFSFL